MDLQYSIDELFFNALYGKKINNLSKLLNEHPEFATKPICGVSPLYIATSTSKIDPVFITLLLENGAQKDINNPSFETYRTPIDNLDYYNVPNKDEILELFSRYTSPTLSTS